MSKYSRVLLNRLFNSFETKFARSCKNHVNMSFTGVQKIQFKQLHGSSLSSSETQKCHYSKTAELMKNYDRDLELEQIAKRLVLEFKNNSKIYLCNNLKSLIERFYMPRHLKINIVNSTLEKGKPSSVEWIKTVKTLDLCVVNSVNLNKNSQVELDFLDEQYNLNKEILNNITNRTKIISILNVDNRIDINPKPSLIIRPDLIFTSCGVLTYNVEQNCAQLVEHAQGSNLNDITSKFNKSFYFSPIVDKDSIKQMPQECY